MPQVTREYRTIMYSYKQNRDGTLDKSHVIVHQLPHNANEKYGMAKLQNYVKRGFMFDDPRVERGNGLPEVKVTDQVDLGKPERVEAVEVPPEAPEGKDGSEEEVEAAKKERATKKTEVPAWGYYCTKCQKVHNNSKKIGKRHLKHKRA